MEGKKEKAVIALIEDDPYIGNMLEEVLKKAGYEMIRAHSGEEGLKFLKSKSPDLVLLDLMLPGISGEYLLRQAKVDIPVIVVSAKKEVKGKVELLLEGAVDYITKPFDVEELLARITVQLRKKAGAAEEPVLAYNGLSLRPDTHRLLAEGEPVKLTKTEFCIMELLMKNPMHVLSKSVLLEAVNEFTPDCQEDSLKVHVSNLRSKLRQATGRDYIEAVWGIGFRLREL